MQALETAGAPRFCYAGLTLKGVGGDGTFSGYASLFGEVDLGRDAIEPGHSSPRCRSAAQVACACFTSTIRPR